MADFLPAVLSRRLDYRQTFGTPQGKRVLADLHRFCMQGTPTADPDEAVFTQGMQRVFRRIAGMINMDENELIEMYNHEEQDSDG